MIWIAAMSLAVMLGSLVGYFQREGLVPVAIFSLTSLFTILIGDFYEVRGQLIQALFMNESLALTLFSYFMLFYLIGWLFGIIFGKEPNIKPSD